MLVTLMTKTTAALCRGNLKIREKSILQWPQMPTIAAFGLSSTKIFSFLHGYLITTLYANEYPASPLGMRRVQGRAGATIIAYPVCLPSILHSSVLVQSYHF